MRKSCGQMMVSSAFLSFSSSSGTFARATSCDPSVSAVRLQFEIRETGSGTRRFERSWEWDKRFLFKHTHTLSHSLKLAFSVSLTEYLEIIAQCGAQFVHFFVRARAHQQRLDTKIRVDGQLLCRRTVMYRRLVYLLRPERSAGHAPQDRHIQACMFSPYMRQEECNSCKKGSNLMRKSNIFKGVNSANHVQVQGNTLREGGTWKLIWKDLLFDHVIEMQWTCLSME